VKQIGAYLILITLAGCTQERITAESILGVQDQFRGISIGDDLETVLTELDCAEVTPYSNERIDGFNELGKKSTLQVSLELNDDHLVAIQADIFLSDEAETLRIMDELSELLSSRYGFRADRSDFRVWLDQGGKMQPTEFALTDETNETGSPKLSITIYNFER
jgi:hypothetical protein